MNYLTIIGHGLGGALALQLAHEDKNFKYCVTLDPIMKLIDSQKISIEQPHCSINSEISFIDPLQRNKVLEIFEKRQKTKGISGNILASIDKLDHIGFSDLPLILNVELKVLNKILVESSLQNCDKKLKLIANIIENFFILNGIKIGSYDQSLSKCKMDKDAKFLII